MSNSLIGENFLTIRIKILLKKLTLEASGNNGSGHLGLCVQNSNEKD